MNDTLKSLLIAGVTAAVTVIGTITVGSFGYFNKDKELDIQLVNVGLSILRGEATGDKDTIPARRFALRLLRKYADVEIPDKEFEEWASKGKLPFKATASAVAFVENLKSENHFELFYIDDLLNSLEGGRKLNSSDLNDLRNFKNSSACKFLANADRLNRNPELLVFIPSLSDPIRNSLCHRVWKLKIPDN